MIGVGDQQANDKITLPAANQVHAQCIGEGDNLNVDITAYFEGMHGDTNYTFFVGDVDDESRNLVLRTHTSPVQVRTMMSQKPPIRPCASTRPMPPRGCSR